MRRRAWTTRWRTHLLALTTADALDRWQERRLTGLADGTAQRILNDLRSALNTAAKRHRDKLPPSFAQTIKDGLAHRVNAGPAVAREAQVLTDADVRRVISAAWEIDREGAWNGDLARLVLVLAATGARFGQVIRMKVGDVQERPAHGSRVPKGPRHRESVAHRRPGG